MLSLTSRPMIVLMVCSALAALPSCAPVHLQAIPEPPPTAKLRVFVQAYSTPAKATWRIPHDLFVANQVRRVERFLEETGIYEVVDERDVRAVLGERAFSREEVERNSWQAAREIGRALHADYIMIIERSKERGVTGQVNWFFTSTLINTTSGKEFRGRASVPRVTKADLRQQVELMKLTYREIFTSAKDDMLAVALRKGQAQADARTAAAAPAPRPQAAAKPSPVGAPPAVRPAPATPEEEGEEEQEGPGTAAAGEAALQSLMAARGKGPAGIKIVVYDFEAPEQYRPAAQILTEALREELFRLKRFVLVNRETLQKVLEEIALQQTGLIDEKQAVRTGRGLAANQVVTGSLGTLGKVFLFQAKRTDVETFATLGVTSAKFTQGQEEEVLDKLPGLARMLAGQE